MAGPETLPLNWDIACSGRTAKTHILIIFRRQKTCLFPDDVLLRMPVSFLSCSLKLGRATPSPVDNHVYVQNVHKLHRYKRRYCFKVFLPTYQPQSNFK